VAARGVLIQQVLSTLPVLNALVHHGDHVVHVGTFDDQQIFYEEAVFRVSPAVKDIKALVQQVEDLFVVNFAHGSLHVELFGPFCH